jgi:hypothetical protein
MELNLNGAKLRVYEDGKIEKFGKRNRSKEETWFQLKGSILTKTNNYQIHHTSINKKYYITSRIIYFAFHPDWKIHDSNQNNTIDHIDRNSLNNNLSNLRIFTSSEQSQNRNFVINANGYYFRNDKYESSIRINGKKKYLGSFDTEEEAHQTYLNAKNKLKCV